MPCSIQQSLFVFPAREIQKPQAHKRLAQRPILHGLSLDGAMVHLMGEILRSSCPNLWFEHSPWFQANKITLKLQTLHPSIALTHRLFSEKHDSGQVSSNIAWQTSLSAYKRKTDWENPRCEALGVNPAKLGIEAAPFASWRVHQLVPLWHLRCRTPSFM